MRDVENYTLVKSHQWFMIPLTSWSKASKYLISSRASMKHCFASSTQLSSSVNLSLMMLLPWNSIRKASGHIHTLMPRSTLGIGGPPWFDMSLSIPTHPNKAENPWNKLASPSISKVADHSSCRIWYCQIHVSHTGHCAATLAYHSGGVWQDLEKIFHKTVGRTNHATSKARFCSGKATLVKFTLH